MKASYTLHHHSNWGVLPTKTITLLDAAVRMTAFEVERAAKLRAPVDTGAMRASIHTETSKSSNYDRYMPDAKLRRPEAKMFGKLSKAKRLEALVAVGVEYGAHVEFGTSTMAGRPFMKRALKSQETKFYHRVKDAIRRGAI